MLIKLKYKLDEDEIPYGISDSEFNMILHWHREATITVDISRHKNDQLFALNGKLIVSDSVIQTDGAGLITSILTDEGWVEVRKTK